MNPFSSLFLLTARTTRAGDDPLWKRCPMTAEQQLERSVLEGKERDELSAIAQAMSLKTTTRTKKADIIDRILDATGVTANGDSAHGHGANGATNGGSPGSGDDPGVKPGRRPRSAAPSVSEADASDVVVPAAPDSPVVGASLDAAPAVFVEPPELSDGAETGTHQQNGQGSPSPQQQNRNRPSQGQNQNNRNNQNNASQGDGGDIGNRRGRRRRGRERGVGGNCKEAEFKSSLTRAKWSRSRACSTSATRVTGSCAAAGTCRRRRTSTSPSARRGGLPCARATTWRGRAVLRPTTRSTRPSCASTRCRGSTPKWRATAPVSRT